MEYIILIIGFVLLIKGADFFVEGRSSVAKQLRVPSMIIGLTIVAMGTSLPECSVSITAALAHKNGLAISNAVGSNTFNLMVVCGACTLFCPLAVQKETLKKEFPFSIAAALLLLGFGFTGMLVGHMEGFVMVVDSASTIAKNFGMTDTLIGLTIVAFGTSLPELVTSIVAARKDEVDMALGNVIGSNIFNILLVLGVAAAISPITFSMQNIIDIIVLVIMSILVLIFAATKKTINRTEGIIMLVLYAGYVVYICNR